MYRAPFLKFSHTLRNLTGLGEAMKAGDMGELSDDLLDAIPGGRR